MESRIGWNSYFMNIANQVKLRSPDPKRQVGAVLVDCNHKVISCGYNGLPSGCNDNINWDNREFISQIVVHAEMNCILYAMSRFENSILYTTSSPCKDCLKLIAAAGIKEIYYDKEYRDIEQVQNLCKYLNIKCVKL